MHTTSKTRILTTGIALASALALSGCSLAQMESTALHTGKHAARHHRHTQSAGSSYNPGVPSSVTATMAPTTHTPVQTGVGYNTSGLLGPIPAPNSCHFTRLADGEVGPDPHCTPGAIDTQHVTQANITSTICRPGGYTTSVRAPESMTEAYKRQVMAAYGVPWSQAHNYELDHLIELSTGGSNSTLNLWPEPDNDADHYKHSGFVHNDKDKVEEAARTAVCNGSQPLATIQNAFASNWTSLIRLLGMPQ